MISVLSFAIAALLAVVGVWAATYLPFTYSGMNHEPEDFYLDIFWTVTCVVGAAIGILTGSIFFRRADRYGDQKSN